MVEFDNLFFCLLGVILGAMLGGWVALAIGRPKVKLSIANAPEMQMFGQIFTSLRIEISNEGRWWTVDAPVLGCGGKIVFYGGSDGQDIFGQPMAMRWTNMPHPEPLKFRSQDGLEFHMWDTDRFIRESRMDINPGDSDSLDVAVRFSDEAECYAWNTDSYLYGGRHPNWQLGPGVYFAKVTVNVAGRRLERFFRIHNDVSRSAFRLTHCSAADRRKIRKAASVGSNRSWRRGS